MALKLLRKSAICLVQEMLTAANNRLSDFSTSAYSTAIGTAVLFERQGIPEDLLKAIAGDDFDEFDLSQALGRFIAFSFVHRQMLDNGEPASYDMHRLVQLRTMLSLGMYDLGLKYAPLSSISLPLLSSK